MFHSQDLTGDQPNNTFFTHTNLFIIFRTCLINIFNINGYFTYIICSIYIYMTSYFFLSYCCFLADSNKSFQSIVLYPKRSTRYRFNIIKAIYYWSLRISDSYTYTGFLVLFFFWIVGFNCLTRWQIWFLIIFTKWTVF